jgi:hypothetical protein
MTHTPALLWPAIAARNLARYRAAKEWSTEQLSWASGVPVETIERIELDTDSAFIRRVRQHTWLALDRALEVPAGESIATDDYWARLWARALDRGRRALARHRKAREAAG